MRLVLTLLGTAWALLILAGFIVVPFLAHFDFNSGGYNPGPFLYVIFGWIPFAAVGYIPFAIYDWLED